MENTYKAIVKRTEGGFIGTVSYYSGNTKIFSESCKLIRDDRIVALIDAEARVIELEEKTKSLLYGSI